MAGEDIDWNQAVTAGLDHQMNQINKCFPGKVVAFDVAAGTADVQPMLKRQTLADDGTKTYDSLPLLPALPVMFPRGGGWVMSVPLTAGDFVWVMCSDSGMAEWLATGQESEPWDTRKHHLSNAVCMPGAWPDPQPLASGDSSARGAGMVLGKDGADAQIRMTASEIKIGASATAFVALANLVQTALDNIRTTFNTHTHPAPGGATSAPTTPMSAQGPVAATLVKAK